MADAAEPQAQAFTFGTAWPCGILPIGWWQPVDDAIADFPDIAARRHVVGDQRHLGAPLACRTGSLVVEAIGVHLVIIARLIGQRYGYRRIILQPCMARRDIGRASWRGRG